MVRTPPNWLRLGWHAGSCVAIRLDEPQQLSCLRGVCERVAAVYLRWCACKRVAHPVHPVTVMPGPLDPLNPSPLIHFILRAPLSESGIKLSTFVTNVKILNVAFSNTGELAGVQLRVLAVMPGCLLPTSCGLAMLCVTWRLKADHATCPLRQHRH